MAKTISSFWYTGRDSNPQPSEPESDALSIEPPVHALQPRYYSKILSVCKEGNLKNFPFVSRFFAEIVVFPAKVCYTFFKCSKEDTLWHLYSAFVLL